MREPEPDRLAQVIVDKLPSARWASVRREALLDTDRMVLDTDAPLFEPPRPLKKLRGHQLICSKPAVHEYRQLAGSVSQAPCPGADIGLAGQDDRP